MDRQPMSLAQLIFLLFIFILPFLYAPFLDDFADFPKRVAVQLAALGIVLSAGFRAYLDGSLRIKVSVPVISLLAFLGWSAVSLIPASCPSAGSTYLLHLAACGIIGWHLVSIISSGCRADLYYRVLIISMGAVSGIGSLQSLFSIDWIPQVVSPAATFANPNIAAMFVGLVFPTVIPLWVDERKPAFRIGLAAIAALSGVYLIMSATRAAWLAAGISSMIAFHLLVRAECLSRSATIKIRRFCGLSILCFAVLSLSLIVFMPNSDGLSDRIKNLVRHQVRDSQLKTVYSDTTSVRIALWRNGLTMFMERPIMGFGLGHFQTHYPRFHRKAVIDRAFNERRQPSFAHNDFLQIAIETGIIGVGAWLILLLGSVRRAFGLLKSSLPLEARLSVIASLGGIVSYLVFSAFSFPFYCATPPLLLFIHIGVIEGLSVSVGHGRYIAPVELRFNRLTGALVLLLVFIGASMVGQRHWREFQYGRYVLMAKQEEGRRSYAQSAELATKASRYDDCKADARLIAGLSFIELGQAQRAADLLERMIASHPFQVNALINLGVAHHLLGHDDRAKRFFRRALAIYPDAGQAHLNLGKIRIREKQYAAALAHFEKAAAHAEPSVSIYSTLGFLYYQTGDFKRSADALETVLRIDNGRVFAHRTLAGLYLSRLDDRDRACHHIKRYVERGPDDEVSKQFRRLISTHCAP